MPRSRNSRSASPQKSVSTESIADFEHRSTFQNVHDIFCEAINADVIQLVLQECSWKEEEAIEKLLTIAESRDEQRKYKSKLHRIAEGVFGSLRSEDYEQNITTTATSSLSPLEKVIRRPSKSPATSEKTGVGTPKLQNVSSSEQLLARGLAPSFYLSGGQGNGNSSVDEIEMDLHFPQLPTKAFETNLSSASSSVSSQRSHNEVIKSSSSSKTVLLSQAQSAFNQQFDDAEGTQRWEQYKQKLSEHYLVGLTKENPGVSVKGHKLNITSKQSSSSFPDDPAILQAELENPRSESNVSQKDVERPRSEMSRNFPVRLLSRSPDTVQEDKLPSLISGRNAATRAEIDEFMSSGLDCADLDETVLKCIYEVHGDLLDEKELDRSLLSQYADSKKPGTPTSQGQTTITQSNKPTAQQSNEAMTLPTIGLLSVNAIEFVPRPKPTVTTSVATSVVTTVTAEVKDTSLQPASKKSKSIEIKSGIQNARTSPSVTVRSPLTVSPSLSPCLSSPTSLMNSPVANLTGSPMFITPKWPQVFHSINRPPPMAPPTILASTTSRFISSNPTHLTPPGYRFPQPRSLPGPLPFSSRMVYTVAPPPPLFGMAGMPPRYVPQPTLQIGENIEDRAAIATGQPIMATSESARHISPPTGLPTVKLLNQTFLEQKVERLRTLQQSGLKVLVVVRGLPGSGKTTLARALQLNGIVLSTDDYYMKGNIYDYSPDKLTEAHQWNRERSKEAMKMRKSPIIIDNTNTQVWEFKPYISMALTYNYHIELFEPETPWKYNSKELARRTLHGVPQDQIQRMSNRYEHNITVDNIIRKRKADPKISETLDASESAGEFSRLDDKSSAGQEELSAHTGKINENKSAKDLIRLQNFYKGEDLRKQKSAESDSDSISSYHSGSLSNQSSRNASPKPLRPSLKTPVALHKMEKLKPPVMAKPIAINPAANKVKRKAIKQMESKLSSETVQVVDDVVNEHVGDKILSVDDVRKLEDELKALLMFYPMNESEVVAAEELIGLKLHDIIHQSIDIAETEDDAEEDSDYESTENVHNKDTELETCDNAENAINFLEHDKELKKQSENKEVIVLEPQENENKENEVGKKIDSDSLKSVPHNENDAMQNGFKTAGLHANMTERVFPSWTEIAHIKKDVKVNTGIKESRRICGASGAFATIDGILESIKLDDAAVDIDDINPNEFELQYWGKLSASFENKVIVAESIHNPWDDIACNNWEGLTSTGHITNDTKSENGSKSQRQKRNQSVDVISGLSLTNEITESNSIDAVVDEEDVDIFVDTNVDRDVKVTENNSEQLNGIKEEIDILGLVAETEAKSHSIVCTEEVAYTTNEIENTFTETEILDKHISCQTVSGSDRDNDIEATFCSSIDIDGSQDIAHVSSHPNSSLQMLKESYIDTESAIYSPTDTDNDKGVILVSDMDTGYTKAGKVKLDIYDDLNDIEIESSVRVNVDHVNFYETKSTDSGTTALKDENCIKVQSNENGDICEENSDDITGYCSSESLSSSEIESEGIAEAKSSESLPSTEIISVSITEVKSNESLPRSEVVNVDITEVNSSESLPISQVGSVDITDVKSSETLKLSEDSEMESSMNGESDSEMTPHTSPQKLTPISVQRSKKSSRRKMAANLSGPFLNNEDKEKFRTNAWNSFPIRGIEKQVSFPTNRKLRNGRDLANAMTVTEMEYFNLVTRLNHGGFVDGSIKYVTGNTRTFLNGNHSGVELNKLNDTILVNEVLTLDKSTSTDDFVSMTDTESVEFLQTCFPAVPLAELECVLENCANNVEWAINLLLDWKYSLNLTEDEKRNFTEVMAEVKKRTSPETVELCSSANETGPISLLDMCFNVVERGNIASREDLEQQLIQTGKERLDRIEDDNITKIRLHRSISLSETYMNIGNDSPSKHDISVFRSLSSTNQMGEHQSIYLAIENNEFRTSVAEKVINVVSNINETSKTGGIDIVIDDHKTFEVVHKCENEIFGDVIDVDGADTALLNHTETVAEDDGDVLQPALTMTLESDVIGKLEDMFGPLGNRNDVNDGLLVSLDHKTAWLMYQCVKQSIKSRRSQLQHKQQQLIKDEELARQLQEEENAFVRSGFKSTRVEDAARVSRSKRSTPLVGLSVMGTIPRHIEPVAWNRGNQSLAEIMQEQQRIEENQQKLVKLIETEGGHTAASTQLKRRILYGRFPKLEKNILDEILQDYCFNLTETFDAISLWLGEDVMGATSATTSKQDDQQLLEATKQQSMHEMLDSYIYHPVVSKDYQDGAEPEYEDFRGEANLHYRLRHECFQKAREAYTRGLKQVASFYSQQGHQHTHKMKEANMRASEQILAERNNDIEKNMTLDLHGLHVDEAIEAIDKIIQRKEIERCKNLIIITGRGSHSRGGVARLRPSIITYLNTHKYNYNELQTGVFRVSLKYRT